MTWAPIIRMTRAALLTCGYRAIDHGVQPSIREGGRLSIKREDFAQVEVVGSLGERQQLKLGSVEFGKGMD